MLAALAEDPDSGIITYGDTTVRHYQSSETVLEFLDFYQTPKNNDLRYLVFDSKFTTYQNLAQLSCKIKFLTIRRRGEKIVGELESEPHSLWKKVSASTANGKTRNLKVIDETGFLKDYGNEIRQIAITEHGKIKQALLITNDFEKPCVEIIRKYARRWLVEKSISEQIEFFHLNRVSSSMVIKVDFDLTMSILAHNLIQLYALDLPGYTHIADCTFINKFLSITDSVDNTEKEVIVKLKKIRDLPSVLTAMEQFKRIKLGFSWKRKLIFFRSDCFLSEKLRSKIRGLNQTVKICDELISNSLKHAFPNDRKGAITITLQKQETELELIVMDDGIVMPARFDLKNVNTLGFKLIHTLVENQLRSSIKMEKNIGRKLP